MTLLSPQVAGYMERASWIRRMFEAGAQLKQQYGQDAVCDFSLGNPDLPPPPAVADGLRALADIAHEPFALGYMPNGGYAWARQKLAAYLSVEHGIPLTEQDSILTCGAAGGINAFLRAVLSPGDEVLAMTPCFVEYGFYVENHSGIFRTVPTQPDTFAPDLDAIEAAITPKTRAIIVNSPNNPAGVVYTAHEIAGIIAVLQRASHKYGHPVWLISDEPYRFLTYDGVTVPSVLPLYAHAVVISSFSKNLSMPGERVGYVATSPLLEDRTTLINALTLTNRILGFVNPPVVGQYLMAAALGSQVDVGVYTARRNAMSEMLTEAGYEFRMPAGAFYFFPKAPGGDDVAFVARLQAERVLAVPGTGFGCPGYFRLAFCVDEAVIRRATAGFIAAKGP